MNAGGVFGAILGVASVLNAYEFAGKVKTKDQQGAINLYFDLVVLPSIFLVAPIMAWSVTKPSKPA